MSKFVTEFELEYLLTETGIASLQAFGMYVTVTVAYLVAAYTTGKDLSKSQVLVVNTLYIISASVMTWATVGYITRAIPFADALELIHPGRRYGMQPPVQIAVAVVELSGILASLKFMWDVRHTKTD